MKRDPITWADACELAGTVDKLLADPEVPPASVHETWLLLLDPKARRQVSRTLRDAVFEARTDVAGREARRAAARREAAAKRRRRLREVKALAARTRQARGAGHG